MAAVTLPTHYRNVFAEQGYAQAEIDARIENSWKKFYRERTDEKYFGNSCTNDGERQPNNRQHKSTPCTKSTMLSGAGGVVVQFSRSAKTINLRS